MGCWRLWRGRWVQLRRRWFETVYKDENYHQCRSDYKGDPQMRGLDDFVAGERLDIRVGFGANSSGVADERNSPKQGERACSTFDFGQSILCFFERHVISNGPFSTLYQPQQR